MLNRRSAMLVAVVTLASAPVAAEPAEETPKGARWSLALAGGALAPVGAMREGYQDALVAGLRLAVRARIGIGVQLAVDYSPLPRRATDTETFDTAYGTAAVLPSWTFGRGIVRAQLGAGGGVAAERTSATRDMARTSAIAPAVVVQGTLELHLTRGGGFVLLAGATRTFESLDYQYAWGLGGLALEF